MTPRKLQALLLVHYDVIKAQNGVGNESTRSSQGGFIDTIPGWN